MLLRSLKTETKRRSYRLEVIMNMILVYHHARTAYLFESGQDAISDRQEAITFVHELAEAVGLTVTPDPNGLPQAPRFLVTYDVIPNRITEKQLGKLLGFQCADHDFTNRMGDIAHALDSRDTNYIRKHLPALQMMYATCFPENISDAFHQRELTEAPYMKKRRAAFEQDVLRLTQKYRDILPS